MALLLLLSLFRVSRVAVATLMFHVEHSDENSKRENARKTREKDRQ
jgi:hypothetical protein